MAEPDRTDSREGGEDEEEVDDFNYKTVKDALLFAIDVSPSMLTIPSNSGSRKADRDSPASAALKCAYHLMQQRIISNPNDMIGILLFGTERSKVQEGDDHASKGGLAYPHCYLLTDLDIPDASGVKALKSLVEGDEEAWELLKPSTEPVSMTNVLFCANQIFARRAPNFTSRRLFLVTDNDDPHATEKALRSAAAVRAKDLYDLGVTIELFPISRPEHDFDRSKFYNDIIYQASPTDPEALAPISGATKASSSGDGIGLLKSLLSSIKSKAVVRRALFSNLPFEIGPDFKISVKGYILFKRQEPARSCYIWLNGEKAQIAKGISTQTGGEDSRPIEKAEVKKAFKFGGEHVLFTKEETAALRNFGDPVIRIIGFKPIAMLPIWASLKPATFIYPSEEDYVGSTRVFSALHRKLLRDEKMGVAWFIARKNAAPVIAAILPGAERLGEQGEQVIPPGMWIIPIPYADDIRQNPETTLVRSPDSLVDMMRTIIGQLQLPKARYAPEKYSNPALQWHYRILQALALEEDLPEKPEDNTIPKYRQIEKRAGEYILDWGHELETQYRAWRKSAGTMGLGSKRAAEDETLSLPKRAKTATHSLKDHEMRDVWQNQLFTKINVAQLKEWLVSKGIDTGAKKKPELILAVEEYFEKK